MHGVPAPCSVQDGLLGPGARRVPPLQITPERARKQAALTRLPDHGPSHSCQLRPEFRKYEGINAIDEVDIGRAIWRRWSGYHRRSRVETWMHRIKLLGQRLAARDFDRQVAEVQIRVAILNGFTAPSIPNTPATG